MKLDIQSVKFKNFLSFGSNIQEIILNKGVNIVLGRDIGKRKSNGAGKSSFLETIPFALFGQVQRNIKKEQIINWKNKRNCEVTCSFQIGENNYEIIRAIKPDNFEIWCNNTMLDKPSHIREYQQQLDEILGINFQTFMSLIHSNINSSQKILGMGKPEKRKFLERVFNLEIYSKIHEQANEKLKSFDDKINLLNVKTNQKDYSLKEASERIERLENEMEKYIGSTETLHTAQTNHKRLTDNNPTIKKDFEEAASWTIIYEKEAKTIEKNIDTIINDEIKKVRFEQMTPILKDLEYIEKEKITNDETEQWKNRFKIFIKKWGKFETIKENEENSKKLLKNLSNFEKKLNKKLNEKNIKIAENKIEIKIHKKTVLTFKDGICPTCGQSIKDENKILEVKTKYRAAVINNEKLQEEHDKIKAELWDIEDERRKKEIEQIRIEEIKEEYFKLKERANKNIKITDKNKENKLLAEKILLTKTIDKLEKKAIRKEEQLELWNEKLKNAVEEEGRIWRIKEAIDEAKKIMEQLEERVKTEDDSKRSIEKLIKSEKLNIKKIIASVNESIKERKKLSSIVDYLEYIKEICKDENIKQYAISFLMPYLNQQLNHYLSEVGYGFFAVLDKWLDAEIKGPSIINGTYGSLSGGEARGIDLALQFALLDIARIRAARWPDVLIMDEILDSSVDSTGIEKLMEIIRVKQIEDDSKIFIISHRDEIGDNLTTDNILNVIKENGYSRIEQ